MRRTPLFVAVFLTASAFAAGGASSAKKPFSAQFVGENGGYKHPDQETSDFMGAGPRPSPPAPVAEATRPTARSRAEVPPPHAVGTRSTARSRAEVPPPHAVGTRPTDAAAASEDSEDARAGADRDYETRVLGLEPAARPPLGARGPDLAAAPGASEAGRLFVSLELDPRQAGSLRDAVAGLGAAAGFSADVRFALRPGPGGTALVSGWIPASRLADAVLRPGVKRLSIETFPRPSAPRSISAPFLVELRVDGPREDAAAGAVRSLEREAGFRLSRVVGFETSGGRTIARVEGSLPLARLGKALARPEVAKIAPSGASRQRAEAEPPRAIASPPSLAGVVGFARFAVERGLWLILLTLALALPSLRAAARRLAEVFNPYR